MSGLTQPEPSPVLVAHPHGHGIAVGRVEREPSVVLTTPASGVTPSGVDGEGAIDQPEDTAGVVLGSVAPLLYVPMDRLHDLARVEQVGPHVGSRAMVHRPVLTFGPEDVSPGVVVVPVVMGQGRKKVAHVHNYDRQAAVEQGAGR